MLTPLTRKRLPCLAWLGVAVSALALTACGGGGGGNTPSSSNTNNNSSGTSVTGAVTLSGVAAMGAPLIGATVTVLDANGADCGSTTTALADGTYTLPLTCSTFTLPLLIEVAGPDMFGAPQVLHSVMQAVTVGSTTTTSAHINPLTNAVVAMLMGGEPTAYFQAGKASAAGSAAVRSARWSLLSSSGSLKVASDVLKTAIRPNLNDAGLTNAALVDFFTNTDTVSFSPTKTGLDATLEGLRIQFGRSSGGDELLQLSNRLLQPCNPSSVCSASTNLGSPEVVFNLTNARNSLNSATPTAAATTATITTTVKVTTSTSALMTSVGQLETMRGAINGNIRPPSLPTDLVTLEYATGKPIFASTFTQQDGLNALAVANTLIGYGTLDYQLSSFMILGCMDYPFVARCTKVRLAAMVRNLAGIQGVFEITANYVAATSSWSFVGNGRQSSWRIAPATWRYLNGDGSALASSSTGPNPGQGVQASILSIDPVSPLIADIVSATGSVRLYNCYSAAGDAMCLSHYTNSGQEAGYETGDLVLDQILPTTQVSWLGPTDTRPGTRFQMTATGIGVNETSNLILPADLPSTSNTALYPVPDGLSASAPLLNSAVDAGLTISWNTWAAANPGLRVVEVRAVITRPPYSAPAKQVFAINPLAGTQLTIPAFSSVPSDAVERSLWLIAQDGLGRRYITKIVAL